MVRGLDKTFPGTTALRNVDWELRAGEIHALCGGNGSGKSTLIKILSGIYKGSAGGTIRIADAEVAADEINPKWSHEAGVRVVHQDLGLFPDMTVAENLSLGRGFEKSRISGISWRKVEVRVRELLERFEIEASPATLLSSLSPAVRTEVAIARALQDQGDQHRGTLIIDEATAALPLHEAQALFASLRRFAARGQSVVFVSHRLDEVLSLCDRVSVLRDGDMQGTWDTASIDEAALIRLVVGKDLEQVRRDARPSTQGPSALKVSEMDVGPVSGVSFEVARGEILGIAGLLGSGRSELLRGIFGDLEPRRGAVEVDGQPIRVRRPADAMSAGIALIPEDRAVAAAFADQSLSMNISAAVLRRYWRRLRMRPRSMARDARALVGQFGIKAARVDQAIDTLSGGNQQKAILARWLQRDPRVILLDEPTQGVDVGARAEIYRLIGERVAAGAGAVLVASDFEELASFADRVLVLRDGCIQAEVPCAEITPHRLSQLVYSGGESHVAVH
ncbi:sugar ABC transporter ATP-binding protein [Nocardioides sp.]|uniref:sugar ABC transporter ATP-binding protein n=1 Tax=Nocardioides sp. TaxID=35761 RepID=UPI002629033D|nr:sugar ABC transporter ATP-binding protein [Nocardioides sp.]MDI6909221.1 sugar ABC transporter ATP-binding protein [Nocardioides sp.]